MIAINTQEELVDYLIKNPCKTENEICLKLWKYDRKTSYLSNKKYAELIRRALRDGKIARVKAMFKGKDTRKLFYYFVPGHLSK